MRPALGLVAVLAVLHTSCDDKPNETIVRRVTLVVESATETSELFDRPADDGFAFVVLRVTMSNSTDTTVLIEPELFELEDAEGRVMEAFTLAGDDEACADEQIADGEAFSCNLAFTMVEGAALTVLRYRRGALVLEASPAGPDFARCLTFIDMIDPACFEMCTLDACFDHDDEVSSCSATCFSSCVDDDDPCVCAAAGCGPGCDDALAAYGPCSAACLVVCGP